MARKTANVKLSENKKEFLEKIKTTKKENTYLTYISPMVALQKYENELGKEFQYFSLDEHRLLFIKSSNQHSTVRVYITVLSLYYSFLQEKGIANIGINPMESLKFKAELEELVDNKALNKYITYKELSIISGMLYNARDKAILLLSWLGLTNDEILNLEIKDINFEERYLIVDDRKIEFDEYVGDILKITEMEEEYFSKNGKCSYESTSKNKRSIPRKLAKSIYLIKGLKNIKCTHNIIHNTFNIIREFKPNDFNRSEELGWRLFAKCNYITPTSVGKSHFFTKVYEMEKEYRKKHEQDFKNNSIKAEKNLNRFLQVHFKENNMSSITAILRDYQAFRDNDLKREID